MSQPVRLSDDLINAARATANVQRRSVAGQIEFWAQLGRAVEPLLRGATVTALHERSQPRPLSACLESVDSVEGHRRVFAHLRAQPLPHYGSDRDRPDVLVRTDADGARSLGRFSGRRFQTVS